jgi:hypothetical protein
MSASELIELIAGLIVIALIAYDVFSSAIVPRQVGPKFRLSGHLVRFSWHLWRGIGFRMSDEDRREDWLAAFAPNMLMALLFFWLISYVAGYGLALYGLREQIHPIPANYGDAFYFAGTSFLTIGFGDIVAVETPARLVTLAAAATGLSLFAVLISLIFSLFGSFQRREAFVVMMGSRAGSPASGVSMLETALANDMMLDLATSMREGELWTASVLDSHLAYPILVYLRSSHDDESWLGTLGAMLDAATLLITCTDSALVGQAKLFHRVGVHLVRDLSRYFDVVRVREIEAVGIERVEFDQACAQLSAAGLPMRCDDASWQTFSDVRKQYAGPLNDMARYWAIPPARWIGDRSELPPRKLQAASHSQV